MNRKRGKIFAMILAHTFLLLLMTAITGCTEAPANAITVEFEDVSQDDWFYQHVVDALRFGIIVSESDDGLRFEPNQEITQGEFIAMLGRLHEFGHGTIGADSQNYEQYIEWAMELGLIHNYRYWDWMPHEPISREQKVTILHRYLNTFNLWDYVRYKGGVFLNTFRDYDEMSDWAKRPVEFFRTNFMVFQRHGYFRPNDTVARVAAVVILVEISYATVCHPLGTP